MSPCWKPCARADRGCRGKVTGSTPYMLSLKKYCSQECAFAARKESGWKPTPLTRAAAKKGWRKGGVASGEVRRQLAVARAMGRVYDTIPPEILTRLGKDAYRLTGVIAEAYRIGWRDCVRNRYKVRRREEQEGADV